MRVTFVMVNFPARVCMREANPQVGRALRPPREQVTNQVARDVRNAADFNTKKNLLRQHLYSREANTEGTLSHWKVVVWESKTARLKLIDRVVSDCGAHTYRVEELDDIEIAPYSSCCAAVVALGPYQTDETLASEVIGRMKQAGLTVIAHEHGVHSWSVGLRCRALLAGASCVLDSDESRFSQVLRRVITEVITKKTRESAESERIHELMSTFGIIGESDAITGAFRQALRISSFSDLAVLITGESGTGKELMHAPFTNLIRNVAQVLSCRSTVERSVPVLLKVRYLVISGERLREQIEIEKGSFALQPGAYSSWTRLENLEATFRQSCSGYSKITVL